MKRLTEHLCHLSALIMCAMLLGSCNRQEVDLGQLLGKSKTEVLEFAFNHLLRPQSDEINIMIKTPIGENHNFYYKNRMEAVNDERLMYAERWEIFVAQKMACSIFCNEVYVELFFRNGKVFDYALHTWNKT